MVCSLGSLPAVRSTPCFAFLLFNFYLSMIYIAPSLLSANFAALGDTVRQCENGGADILHYDVMDGHFVPPITMGPAIMNAVREVSALPVDVHLMVQNADHQVEQFAAAGASWISVHAEVCKHIHRTLNRIRQLGCKAGLALNPATPLDFAFAAAESCDFILLMSVNPGYGGQNFIPSFLNRCSTLRSWLDTHGMGNVLIEVDGGIKISNAKEVVNAGAQVLVSGSGIMHGDIAKNISAMRDAIATVV
ncbi:MAG: Ribulose-phosphate 3-epimerase [Chlorobi bacterium]|nr:MAG: pentose-5-phosphate-3-epimerase [Chlorobi bacterium OLB6]MBV6462777.1 Ribulose-phosphate 3-epimerase [Chlorobiota bacterium]